MTFPFALKNLDSAAGARRQGSSTSALTRGLDGERRQRGGCLEQGEGDTLRLGIDVDASTTGTEKTQNS